MRWSDEIIWLVVSTPVVCRTLCDQIDLTLSRCKHLLLYVLCDELSTDLWQHKLYDGQWTQWMVISMSGLYVSGLCGGRDIRSVGGECGLCEWAQCVCVCVRSHWHLMHKFLCGHVTLATPPQFCVYVWSGSFARSQYPTVVYIHDLLPQRRDLEILSRLRRHTAYPIPRTQTNKYRSFIHYALAKYQ